MKQDVVHDSVNPKRPTPFSGYWYKAPVELDLLMDLKHSELKVFIVINKAIERDRNRGLIAIRQIRQRAKMKSLGHTQEAVETLCRLRILARHNPSTGREMTDPKQWRSRPVEYRLTALWRQKNDKLCTSDETTVKSASQDDCTPPREQKCSRSREQHSELSEILDHDCSSNTYTKADSGHVSPKHAEASDRTRDTSWNAGQHHGQTRMTMARTTTQEAKKNALSNADLMSIAKGLAAFMDGVEPPAKLLSWIANLADRYSRSANDIHRTLNAAWNRNARPGRKNRPRDWNWFYELFRNAFVPGYAARLPSAPAQ